MDIQYHDSERAREVADRTVWIEHGQQRDPNNESPDFGNPYANPPGYHVNRHITSRAGKLSKRGRFNWLKDIQSVTPMTQIPDWLISKYFYREMSPLLRYAAVPFLLLFNVSLLFIVILGLDVLGVWTLPFELFEELLRELAFVGALIDFVLFVNVVVITLLTLISIPLFFFARDVKKTLRRFGLVDDEDPEEIKDQYIEAARDVFAAHPRVAAFVYGHTHRASITPVDDRVVVNTGTWLKRLHRQSVVFGILPRVFYPSYRLNYVRIAEDDESVVIDYEVVEKQHPKELTLLERLLTRRPQFDQPIPEQTVIDGTTEQPPTPAGRPVVDHSSPDDGDE